MKVATRDENHAWLTGRFLQRLFALQPTSVLDVGCGAGELLRQCRARGLDTAGLEADPAAQATLQREGFDVRQGAAEALPWDDRSRDWVTLRHVPHHLPDPAAAFAQALRVAATGVLIAEPWFDPGLPGQRQALAADRWLKRQHRRAGMVHHDALDAVALLGALPGAGQGLRVEVEIALRLRARPWSDLEEEAAPLLEALPADHVDRAEYAALRADVQRGGLSWNGSILLVVRSGSV